MQIMFQTLIINVISLVFLLFTTLVQSTNDRILEGYISIDNKLSIAKVT